MHIKRLLLKSERERFMLVYISILLAKIHNEEILDSQNTRTYCVSSLARTNPKQQNGQYRPVGSRNEDTKHGMPQSNSRKGEKTEPWPI